MDRDESPIGTLVLAATAEGLVRSATATPRTHRQLAAKVSPRVMTKPNRLDHARPQLDSIRRPRRTFDLALDLRVVTAFQRLVLEPYAHRLR